MQISNINGVNSIYNNSFKGLWGKTLRKTDIDPAVGVPVITETYYYYPYKGESENSIIYLRGQYTSEYADSDDGHDKIMKQEFKRGRTLPFSEQDFIEYQNSTTVSNNVENIHEYARNMYVDNTYGANQKSAENLVIRDVLDTYM